MANTIELEQELKHRYNSLAARSDRFPVPSPMYIGMFAGSTKPKPFQRKRPNLSNLPPGKLPPLHDMRRQAVDLHRGHFKPCPQGQSRRVKIAMQHIHEGCNRFVLKDVRGLPDDVQGYTPAAVLNLTEDKLIYQAEGRDSRAHATKYFPYEMIREWEAKDDTTGASMGASNGIEITMKDNSRVYFGVLYVRDVKHSLEFYWNRWQLNNGGVAKHGSTHGRPLVRVSTLSGEVAPPPFPQGSSDVVDQDGTVVRAGSRMISRRGSIMNFGKGNEDAEIVPQENREVKEFWSSVVVHQGWLLKKGGLGIGDAKNWIKRYFVLYSTSQGHFLIYYTDFTECPLYSREITHRNVVDLSKTTFIRPGSNKADFSDTPPHSFDIVTTEREWTLCAESQENVVRWLKIITRCVDEDVAILPDEELVFKVKPKVDPIGNLPQNDYSTSLKVSANGISVCTPGPNVNIDVEHHFWAYTDFYKWSLLSQNGKLALLVNVFEDEKFKSRVEYIFRNKEAARLATAIEYFIEKFMTVMHIRLELVPGSFDESALNLPAEETPHYASQEEFNETTKQAALIDLEDDGEIASYEQSSKANAQVNQGQEEDLLDMLGGGNEKESDLNVDMAAYYQQEAPASNNASNNGGNGSSNGQKAAVGGTTDPFGVGSDPFGGSDDPFAASFGDAAIDYNKKAPPLTPEQIQLHHMYRIGVIATRKGPLYDDGLLQIACKIEVKGSQARMTLYYRNIGPASIQKFSTEIKDPQGLVRFELSESPTVLEAKQSKQQILMLECMKPAIESPSLMVNYYDTNLGMKDNTVLLPISVATFNEPLKSLSAADFQARWEQLGEPGKNKQEVLKPTQKIVPAQILEAMTNSLCFAQITGMPDESEFVRYGAASLKTGAINNNNGEKINVGCLVKIEMNVQKNAVRVTARTIYPNATAAIFECARSLLN